MIACPRGGRPAAALLFLLLLTACQTVPPPERADARPQQRLDVPFIPQEAYQCGPAALGMMLQWNGLPGDKTALVDEVWLPERQGALGIELVAAGRARGLLAYPINTPTALIQEVQAGHPVLVLQNLALPQWPLWHYAVVIGYRDGGERIILHSGTDRATESRWNRFLRTWARGRYWGFVLLPPGDLPDSVQPEPLLQALAPMQTGALPYWEAAVARFPDNGRLRFGYANALWQDGRTDAALRAYRATVARAPDLAPEDDNVADSVAEITDGRGC